MREELKSGIVEFDLLVEQFENEKINFVEFTSALWNKGYGEGKKQAYSQKHVSSSLPISEIVDCGKDGKFEVCNVCGNAKRQ